MSRFIVGENGVRAPYWPTSPNSFGGQIGASANGDLPGDIYRLIGGIVMRKKGQAPRYAGYMSSGFLLPKGPTTIGSSPPGSEDILGPTGEKARFFLVGLRPGMVYETGLAFAPAVQIDPILPVNIRSPFSIRTAGPRSWQGAADAFGIFAGKRTARPSTCRACIVTGSKASGTVSGASCPACRRTGGEFYVIEKDRPAGATGLTLNVADNPPSTPPSR